ncbi:MAG: DUF5132 domain-containing protein [Candidatus Methylumidiphilus sp.]
MPKLQELFKSDLSRGVALGLSAALVAVAAVPIIITATRPLARAALKSSLLVYEKGKEALAEAEEHLEDLVAEVKAEMVAERESLDAAEETENPEA